MKPAVVFILLVFLLFPSCDGSEPLPYMWKQAIAQANWSPAHGLAVTPFQDKLWIIGKDDGNWISEDGMNWHKAVSPRDTTRIPNLCVVFQNELYAFGPKTVWRSSDGLDWTLITSDPPWAERKMHKVIVFKGMIWLVGGVDNDTNYKNDVWSSSDGVHWVLAVANPPWEGRCMHTLETWNDKLWIIGGRSDLESTFETLFNDVWFSNNGVTWSEATSSAGWSKRFGHSSAVWKDKLWVMGGSRFFHNNEVWFSSNGKEWIRSKEDAGWSPRFGQTSVVFRDTLWVFGGKYGSGKFTNDVWYLAPNLIASN